MAKQKPEAVPSEMFQSTIDGVDEPVVHRAGTLRDLWVISEHEGATEVLTLAKLMDEYGDLPVLHGPKRECPECWGDGKCPDCCGEGIIINGSTCPTCGGDGECPDCYGEGIIINERTGKRDAACPTCGGDEDRPGDGKCPYCHGTGTIPGQPVAVLGPEALGEAARKLRAAFVPPELANTVPWETLNAESRGAWLDGVRAVLSALGVAVADEVLEGFASDFSKVFDRYKYDHRVTVWVKRRGEDSDG